MAAPLGFKTFATGDVLTAADTNGYLMQGIWVFANATARDAAVTSPQEGNTCYLKDTDQILVYSGSAWVVKSGGSSPLTTKGDLYTYSTTDARLGVGTNGQVLIADSTAATGLKWGTAGGKVLQVVQGTYSTATSTTSSTFVDTNLTATITPSATSSKVMIVATLPMKINGAAGDDLQGSLGINRGGSIILDYTNNLSIYLGAAQWKFPLTMSYLDSPSTTSATTYKIQMKSGGKTTTAQEGNSTSVILLLEIGA